MRMRLRMRLLVQTDGRTDGTDSIEEQETSIGENRLLDEHWALHLDFPRLLVFFDGVLVSLFDGCSRRFT